MELGAPPERRIVVMSVEQVTHEGLTGVQLRGRGLALGAQQEGDCARRAPSRDRVESGQLAIALHHDDEIGGRPGGEEPSVETVLGHRSDDRRLAVAEPSQSGHDLRHRAQGEVARRRWRRAAVRGGKRERSKLLVVDATRLARHRRQRVGQALDAGAGQNLGAQLVIGHGGAPQELVLPPRGPHGLTQPCQLSHAVKRHRPDFRQRAGEVLHLRGVGVVRIAVVQEHEPGHLIAQQHRRPQHCVDVPSHHRSSYAPWILPGIGDQHRSTGGEDLLREPVGGDPGDRSLHPLVGVAAPRRMGDASAEGPGLAVPEVDGAAADVEHAARPRRQNAEELFGSRRGAERGGRPGQRADDIRRCAPVRST